MAEGAVLKYVLDKLGDPLLKKALDLYLVNRQIKRMQLELCLIQDLLRDADSKRNRDILVKRWLTLVRDISYRIEDMIDTFLVEIQENPPKRFGWFSKLRMVVKNPMKLYKLDGELKKITQDLKLIYQRRTDLEITVLGAGSSEENGQLPLRPTRPSHVDDSKTFHIIKQLLDKNISRRMVLSIVGPGGLGKTTLAHKVYQSLESETQFHCCAWLSISQKYNLQDLLKEILFSIEPRMRQQNPPMTVDDLTVQLKSSLRRKRYLIILDDVWTKDLWEEFQKALPPDLNNASRVIITSRLLDVALAADRKTEPYKLRYLNDDESLALLFRKVLQEHIEPKKYPCGLLEVTTRLTKKCGGLPLALVVLGGILTRKQPTFNAWSRMEETMDWHNEDGEQCMKILAMSYEDLPHHLKPCFLYFASFPEDYQISGKHVTKMWVAEGFIPKDGAVLMEDKAEEFLEELVQRSLIQVNKKRWNGYCKYCNIHDLLRDLAIHEAKEVNFFTVFSKTEEDVHQLAARKPRRAAL